MKKKILVLGGAGYIGSMLVTQLVNLGNKITVVDKLKYEKNSLNHLFFEENFKLINKDIKSIEDDSRITQASNLKNSKASEILVDMIIKKDIDDGKKQ